MDDQGQMMLLKIIVIHVLILALVGCSSSQVSTEINNVENYEYTRIENKTKMEPVSQKMSISESNTPMPSLDAGTLPTTTEVSADETHSQSRQIPTATLTIEPTETPSPLVIQGDWVFLESQELGISFQYPIGQQMLKNVSFHLDEWPERDRDPTGTFYSWRAMRSGSGWSYDFAGGASKSGKVGRSRWVTDVYRWVQAGDSYQLELSNNVIKEISPLMIITREDGLQGVIYGSLQWSMEGTDDQGLAATLNFPEGYHEDLGSITFFFYEEISLDLIQEVLESVTFQEQ